MFPFFLFIHFLEEGGKGRQWSGGVILPFLTLHSFTTKVHVHVVYLPYLCFMWCLWAGATGPRTYLALPFQEG